MSLCLCAGRVANTVWGFSFFFFYRHKSHPGKPVQLVRPVLPNARIIDGGRLQCCPLTRDVRSTRRGAEIMHRLSFVMVIRGNSDRKEGTKTLSCIYIYIYMYKVPRVAVSYNWHIRVLERTHTIAQFKVDTILLKLMDVYGVHRTL